MPPSRTGRAYERPPSRIATKIGPAVALLLILFEHRRAVSLMSNSVDDWERSRSNVVCSGIPGLTKEQRELCYKNPDVTAAATEGLQMAISECQYQFMWHRWNCSSLTPSSRIQQNSVLLQRGYRETAFAYAILAAGVAHNVARACSMGRLVSCNCDPSSYKGKTPADVKGVQWKWGGCSHNLDYGLEFSRQFLDTREKVGDIQSTVNLHNNQAGRLAVASNMQIRCKCHGMSGSCELKTCWKVTPDFRIVGKILKERFRSAVLVTQSNLGSVTPSVRIRGSRRRRPDRQRQRKHHGRRRKPRDLAKQLFYYQKSPNFCERDSTTDIAGTAGRKCNKTSTAGDGCASLCCGRGYNVVRQRRTELCHCKFRWCCMVKCQNCTVEEWITVCK
ncbi:Protein Wnt [Camponotus japonicus]